MTDGDVKRLNDPLFLSRLHSVRTSLLGAENLKRASFAVAAYLIYECSPVRVEWAHDIIALLRKDRAYFIFQRGDFIGGRILEVNCDGHGFVLPQVQSICSSNSVKQYEPGAH
jgi:hypothetical protein